MSDDAATPPPPFVQIPTPMVSPRKRGIAARAQPTDPIHLRMSARDTLLVKEEAAMLGSDMTVSNFARWATVYTARALRKARTNEAPDVDG